MTGLLSLSHRPAVLLVGCSLGLTMVLTACAGRSDADAPAGTVTLVNRVRSRVQGLACSTCPSAVEAVLRRRLDNVAITMDQTRQTIDLAFEQTATPFSSASFRQALAEAQGEVVSMTIEACGTIEPVQGRSWLVSGSSRLLVEGSGNFVAGAEICVTGDLRDRERPPRLVLGDFGS
jgi:hypothetical protein